MFRKIDQWGNIDRRALTPQSVNLVLKTRAAEAGLDATTYSAHGLRAGYLTEAANRGIPLPEAMQQSQHKSLTQAASYYNNSERKMGRAARLVVWRPGIKTVMPGSEGVADLGRASCSSVSAMDRTKGDQPTGMVDPRAMSSGSSTIDLTGASGV